MWDGGFNLYKHKNRPSRAEIRLAPSGARSRRMAYPLRGNRGEETILARPQIHKLLRHFDVPNEVLSLPKKRLEAWLQEQGEH